MRSTTSKREAHTITRKTQSAKSQHAIRDGTLATKKREDGDTPSVSLSIKSIRARLLDPDNLCAKWFVDALRYARIIPDDRPQDIIYKISQEKADSKEKEETIVDVIQS